MCPRDIETLKASTDKVVRLHMKDGEIITALVLHASEEEYRDVIYDLLATNRPDRYEKLDKRPHCEVGFDEIAWVEALADETETPGGR